MNTKKLRDGMRLIAAATAVVVSVGGPAALASVDVTSTNDTTGPDSVNRNRYDVDDTVNVDVDNNSSLTNGVSVDVENGDNDIHHNTTVEDITTGDVDVEGSFENELNTAELDLGSLELGDVDADFTNDTTGPNSENVNRLDVDRTLNIDVDNNASVSNGVDFKASTGSNDIHHNTTVGDFTGGDVNFELDTMNELNTGSSLDLSGLMGGSDVNVDSMNGTTGPNSENRNIVNVDDTKNVSVTNNASISNGLSADISTGENKVRNNTTVGDVTTGSVDVRFTSKNKAN